MARELGPKGIHVAHVPIDGASDGLNVMGRQETYGAEQQKSIMIDPEHVAILYRQIMNSIHLPNL